MITDADITKLKKTFTTKEDFGDLRVEVGELSDKVYSLESKIDTLDAKFDRVIAGLDEERQENRAGAVTMNRQERQIHALATGTGVAIPED